MKIYITLILALFFSSCTIVKKIDIEPRQQGEVIVDPAFVESTIFEFKDYFIRYAKEAQQESNILRVKSFKIEVATEKPEKQHETIRNIVFEYFYKRIIVFTNADEIEIQDAAIKTARLFLAVAAHKKQKINLLEITVQDEKGRIYTFNEFPKGDKRAYLSEVY